MGYKETLEELKKQKKREEELSKILSNLNEKPKVTKTVRAYLTAVNLSLKKALSKGYVWVKVSNNKGRYIVTARGNDYKQRRKK